MNSTTQYSLRPGRTAKDGVSHVLRMFRRAMEQAGIVTEDEVIADGILRRFHVSGDKKGSRNGWYALHLEPCPMGVFGSWRTGIRENWKLVAEKRMNPQERAVFEERFAEARAKVLAETEQREARARRGADHIWKNSEPATKDHPYLSKKQVKPYIARVHKGLLVVPLRDTDGNLHSLQFISPLGEKRFLTGGRVTGCCCGLGMPRKLIYIAEGFATGAAIHEATGEAAAIAFNAGNLKTVAKALRKKYPNVELVIAADNDQWTEGNPGLTKAVETAQAVKARVAVPSFTETLTRPTDFCDLFSLRGAEEVKKQLARACAPELLIGVPGVLASQVKPEKVDWLWKNHIPLGAMTLLDGDPGRGKSCITLDLAARVTKGWGMPDGSDAQLPTRGVVVISLEDSISRAILPRLIAAGADLERVRIIEGITGSDGTERLVTVTEDLLPIHKAIHAMDAALVIVDPVMATFDQQTNTWKDQEVRRALVPLIKLCERQNITLLVLRHFNKTQGGNPLYRGGGSIAFIGAARAAFMVGKDPDDETGYVLAMTKSNYGPEVPSLRYRIKGYPEPPHIEWEGESPHHAVNLLDDSEGDEDRGAAKEAEDFIRAMLAVGRVPARDIFTEGKKLGHSERTLKRVKRKLGVRSTLEGQGKEGTWYWEPPERVKDHQEGANGWGLAPSRHPTDINGVNSTISAESANSQTLAPSRIQKPS